MKKILLIGSFLGLGLLNAQQAAPATASFTEGFDGGIVPTDWSVQNLSSAIGTNTNCWNIFGATPWAPQAGVGHIGANFNCVAGAGTISGWLFSPVIMFNNGDKIKFWTRKSNGTTDFPDRVELRLSTNDTSVNAGATATSVGDFTTILVSINPTLVTGVYPQVFTEFTGTISGLAVPTNGRVAFRYFVTNGGPSGSNSDIISIDSFSYENSTLAVDNSATSKMTVYPNPTSDFLNFNTKVSGVQIFDVSGKRASDVEVVNNKANVRNLPKGIYIVKFETSKGIQTQKFIKQ